MQHLQPDTTLQGGKYRRVVECVRKIKRVQGQGGGR